MTATTNHRVAVIGHGVEATRLVRALRELERASGHPCRSVAVLTWHQQDTWLHREADDAVVLPPGISTADVREVEPYLVSRGVQGVAVMSSHRDRWLAWALLCEARGWHFFGPSSAVLRRLLDPLELRRISRSVGVQSIPWSGRSVGTLDEARAEAEKLGYPVLCRTTGSLFAGFGPASSAESLEQVFSKAQAEARASGAEVILERLILGCRRLEVPVLSDRGGQRWALDVIDASLRQRDGSVIAEAPASNLSPELTERLQKAAVALAEAFGHEHLGTMIFLLPQGDGEERFIFLGYDFGRGGEYAAAEALRGIDLAKVRIHLALGDERLSAPPPARGFAAVAHIRAHSTGPEAMHVEHLAPASGPGVRTDIGADAGDVLVADASVSEIVVRGADRAETLSRMQLALQDSALLIGGGESSVAVIARVLEEPEFWSSPVDTDWLVQRVRGGNYRASGRAPVALLQAAIEAYELEHGADREAFLVSAKRGRPEAVVPTPRRFELAYAGRLHTLVVAAVDQDRYQVVADGHRISVRVAYRRGLEHDLRVGEARFQVVSSRKGFTHRVVVDGEPYDIYRDESGLVRAPYPAVVSRIAVEEGESVSAGEVLLMLEAMKTEMSLLSSSPGRVRRVMARPNVQVAPGEPLVWLEPEAHRTRGEASSEVVGTSGFADLASPATSSPLDTLRSLVRGYDVDGAAVRAALRAQGKQLSLEHDDVEKEKALLRAFAGLLEITRAQQDIEDKDGEGGLHLSPREFLRSYLMDLGSEGDGLPRFFERKLRAVLSNYGVHSLRSTSELQEGLCRVYMALARQPELVAMAVALLARQAESRGQPTALAEAEKDYRRLLDRLVALSQSSLPEVFDAAVQTRFQTYDEPLIERLRQDQFDRVTAAVERLVTGPDQAAAQEIVACPLSLSDLLLSSERSTDPAYRRVHLEAMTRRYYRIRNVADVHVNEYGGEPVCRATYREGDAVREQISWLGRFDDLFAAKEALQRASDGLRGPIAVDLYTWSASAERPQASRLSQILRELRLPTSVDRVVFVLGPGDGGRRQRASSPCVVFYQGEEGFEEDLESLGIHPMVAERLELGRLVNFELKRLYAPEDIFAFLGTGRDQPGDRRVFVYAEVRELTVVRDDQGRALALPQLERAVAEALGCLRHIGMAQPKKERTQANRLELFIWPPLELADAELRDVAYKLAPATTGLALEEVRVNAEMGGERRLLRLSNPTGGGMQLDVEPPDAGPAPLLSPYQQKVYKLSRRGLLHPHELIRALTPSKDKAQPGLPPGEFIEHDLNEELRLVPVDRGPGENRSNIIVGVIRSFTEKYPEGMTRVALLGDPSRAMGSLAEPECRRINAALDLAEEMGVPAEWYAVSAGAEISKDRGTENMDWIAAVLRRIIHYTQAGYELNVVVCGINVGAQPYWNAEATMLMHTKGVLVMVPGVAMVLTGKQSLDYSGGVSADDNLGIGGYERIMGPNGQAQYFAEDPVAGGKLLLKYYDHTYRAPGERSPRFRPTADPRDRDVCLSPHGSVEGTEFATIGDVFSPESNPGRKKPFDIRRVMSAVVDADSEPLERWKDMRDAETVVVWDAHLGGYPVELLGIESRPIRRVGFVPADGPRMWTAGTLFPQSSKKAARAINAASGNRPLVILANLSGFDGSPESLRMVQLEFGAEIGRAVVNFEGPIVFLVVSRFHGGAFVVFSNQLHDHMETFALEGTYASVIGGAPAAAVVFARELRGRVEKDARVTAMAEKLRRADAASKADLSVELQEARAAVHSEHLGQLALEYDAIHSVERAQSVGSVHRILAPSRLRLELIEAVERGLAQDGGKA